ncbi:protein MGARP-like [Lepisosteus oculatus]|uniref:protein MGARP-like n=1 Tax=Lepisosteus oculatus TaxID=7918 RepID=UPI0035F50D25
MVLCRAAWRKLAPLARMSVSAFSRNVPARQMSSGGVPGSSGTNLIYILLCGGSFTGAIYYSYKTLTSDKARFHDRVNEISTRPKDEWTPKPWPPKSKPNCLSIPFMCAICLPLA